MANYNKKIRRTLGEIQKVLNSMGTLTPRELEEEQEFDALLEIKETYYKKRGTRELDYDLDPNEI